MWPDHGAHLPHWQASVLSAVCRRMDNTQRMEAQWVPDFHFLEWAGPVCTLSRVICLVVSVLPSQLLAFRFQITAPCSISSTGEFFKRDMWWNLLLTDTGLQYWFDPVWQMLTAVFGGFDDNNSENVSTECVSWMRSFKSSPWKLKTYWDTFWKLIKIDPVWKRQCCWRYLV